MLMQSGSSPFLLPPASCGAKSNVVSASPAESPAPTRLIYANDTITDNALEPGDYAPLSPGGAQRTEQVIYKMFIDADPDLAEVPEPENREKKASINKSESSGNDSGSVLDLEDEASASKSASMCSDFVAAVDKFNILHRDIIAEVSVVGAAFTACDGASDEIIAICLVFFVLALRGVEKAGDEVGVENSAEKSKIHYENELEAENGGQNTFEIKQDDC
ncbi:hypothetical protein BDZ89DRAFT_1048761 [Hymenopellis radicata]|nr:hypothetical protein BDZ89DRAFT_1048761 [Hymenopellis radicata]